MCNREVRLRSGIVQLDIDQRFVSLLHSIILGRQFRNQTLSGRMTGIYDILLWSFIAHFTEIQTRIIVNNILVVY